MRSADEAIAIARNLAESFRTGAAERDRDRILPRTELDAFSASGLWGITVPRAYGGPGLGYAAVAEIIATISAADPAIGQIPQNHLGVLDAVRTAGTPEQKADLFGEALRGTRFGNAFSERGGKTVADQRTRFRVEGDVAVVDGEKFYCTGALFAHIIPIAAADAQGRGHLLFADRDAPGLTVIDDWSSFGQRTTASGTVRIEAVRVPMRRVVPTHLAYDIPSANGPVSQIIQAAVDAGIARGALAETIGFVRTRSRPWIDSGQYHAWEDPYTIAAVGDLRIRLDAAEAVLAEAGDAVDRAVAAPDERTVAEASIAVAEAKVLTTEIALLSTNKLFELAGTRSTLTEYGFDRHWRNARTHTLHDPVRWKFHAIGNWQLNAVAPPRHPWS